MTHEKIISNPDGSRHKIEVRFFLSYEKPCYQVRVLYCPARKRTFTNVVKETHEYRAMSMDDRRSYEHTVHIKEVGLYAINQTKQECWQKLKP